MSWAKLDRQKDWRGAGSGLSCTWCAACCERVGSADCWTGSACVGFQLRGTAHASLAAGSGHGKSCCLQAAGVHKAGTSCWVNQGDAGWRISLSEASVWVH